MGLFKKIKDILYEEEEFTEQIKITPEMRNEQTPNKPVEPKEVIRETVKPVVREETPKTVERESDLFTNSNSFPFDFDEEEFKQISAPAPKPVVKETTVYERHPNNVLEYERRKKVEKRTDYGRYEKTEITETTERKKFKPSPVISPVYGILHQDYSKGDIIQREDVQKMDVQSVRDRAFGDKKVVKEETKEKPKTTYYQESETVTITEPTEKEKKVKTIDELLNITDDVTVDLDNDLTQELNSIEEELDLKEHNQEPKEEKLEKTAEMPNPTFEDTLENDLFNLIDSMYDNKEDGE